MAGRSSKTLLSLDTATGACSVAVAEGADIRAFLHEPPPAHASRNLLPRVERALAEAGNAYANIAHVVVTVGPGGFTGLRVGLSAAQAIGFSTGAEVKGVSTLSCVAWQAARAHPGQPVLAVLGAGKGEVYAQRFDFQNGALHAVSEPELLRPEEAVRAGAAFAGDIHLLPESPHLRFPCAPNAQAAAEIALHAPHLLLPAQPLYVRAPDAVALAQKKG